MAPEILYIYRVTIPASKFLIPAKAGKNVTTFGPAMTDVFADVPEGYTRGRIDPELRKHLELAALEINTMLDGKLTRLVNGTPYLEMSTMNNKEKDKVLVHLVNYDVILDGTITPANDVELQIVIPDGKKVKKISYSGDLGKMQPVAFKEKAGLVHFTIPNVDIYGLATIEF